MRRFVAGTFIAFAGIGLCSPAVAAADPVCPDNTVRVQGEIVAAPAQVCDNDQVENDGLLGDLTVLGNLPGLGGVL